MRIGRADMFVLPSMLLCHCLPLEVRANDAWIFSEHCPARGK